MAIFTSAHVENVDFISDDASLSAKYDKQVLILRE